MRSLLCIRILSRQIQGMAMKRLWRQVYVSVMAWKPLRGVWEAREERQCIRLVCHRTCYEALLSVYAVLPSPPHLGLSLAQVCINKHRFPVGAWRIMRRWRRRGERRVPLTFVSVACWRTCDLVPHTAPSQPACSAHHYSDRLVNWCWAGVKITWVKQPFLQAYNHCILCSGRHDFHTLDGWVCDKHSGGIASNNVLWPQPQSRSSDQQPWSLPPCLLRPH